LLPLNPPKSPVVRAVFFYSPTCPHCHTVINETLVPMMEQYGERLQIIGIDISQPGGQALYERIDRDSSTCPTR
jgi:thiol-disulfide isomerase/thioredoxin